MPLPRFEDVKIGDELPELTIPAVNRTQLALFAGASGDHNPIHIDLDFARRAGYPDVFAQGMLGMAWLGRLLTRWVPQSRLRHFEVRFRGMTWLGNVIHCTGHITEKLQKNGEHCIRVELRAANQYGQVKTVGEATIALD